MEHKVRGEPLPNRLLCHVYHHFNFDVSLISKHRIQVAQRDLGATILPVVPTLIFLRLYIANIVSHIMAPPTKLTFLFRLCISPSFDIWGVVLDIEPNCLIYPFIISLLVWPWKRMLDSFINLLFHVENCTAHAESLESGHDVWNYTLRLKQTSFIERQF